MYLSIYNKILRFLFAFILFLSATSAQGNEMMYYKMWVNADGRQEYEIDLFKLAMELTAAEYPPYVLTQYNLSMGSLRGRREVALGNKVNFYVAPPRMPGDDLYQEVRSISIPIMQGLLGYRKLIVGVDKAAAFSNIKSLEELRKFKVGQGRGWPDAIVYKHAGFSIDDSAQFQDLFQMLDQGRFDFLPLGIMEADKALQKLGKGNKNLTILDSIYIYYPLPAVFQVRGEEKLLIERLTKGLERAQTSGAMSALFQKHYSSALSILAKEDYQLIVLDNPHLESAMGLAEPLLSKNH